MSSWFKKLLCWSSIVLLTSVYVDATACDCNKNVKQKAEAKADKKASCNPTGSAADN